METKEIIDCCWLRTHSGKVIDPTDPKEHDIILEDIAWALSNQCRFGGHVNEFYSVASHCLFVEHLAYLGGVCSPRLLLRALLHDASEAYICDIPTPFKNLLPEYRTLEDKITKVIFNKFKIYDEKYEDWDNTTIKFFDKKALRHEMDYLFDGNIFSPVRSFVNADPTSNKQFLSMIEIQIKKIKESS